MAACSGARPVEKKKKGNTLTGKTGLRALEMAVEDKLVGEKQTGGITNNRVEPQPPAG